MCAPVSEKNNDYKLSFTATGKCDMGESHTVRDAAYCDTFADAFRATRNFWTSNKGREISVTLTISPNATDHLKARA